MLRNTFLSSTRDELIFENSQNRVCLEIRILQIRHYVMQPTT